MLIQCYKSNDSMIFIFGMVMTIYSCNIIITLKQIHLMMWPLLKHKKPHWELVKIKANDWKCNKTMPVCRTFEMANYIFVCVKSKTKKSEWIHYYYLTLLVPSFSDSLKWKLLMCQHQKWEKLSSSKIKYQNGKYLWRSIAWMLTIIV